MSETRRAIHRRLIVCPQLEAAVEGRTEGGRSPEQVVEHTVFGHRDRDLMMVRKAHGKVNVTPLPFERASRYTAVVRNCARKIDRPMRSWRP
ncbi:hypothetical protein [Pseudoponticoccus marisrubri]|nr:hypothetical protein [Pseudoponticoccus marisrubri]